MMKFKVGDEVVGIGVNWRGRIRLVSPSKKYGEKYSVCYIAVSNDGIEDSRSPWIPMDKCVDGCLRWR